MENLKISNYNDTQIIDYSGRIDSINYQEIYNFIIENIETESKKLIFNFENVSYISSAGLRIMLQLAKEMQKRNIKYTICNLQSFVKEIFDLSGFNSFLDIKENLDKAINE